MMTSNEPTPDETVPDIAAGEAERARRRSGRPDRSRPERPGRRDSARSSGRPGPGLALVAVVLLGGALLVVGALWGTGLFGSQQARTQAAVQTADGHWQKATVALERAATALAGVQSAAGPSASARIAAAAVEASAGIGAAQVELKAAGEAIAALPGSKLKTSYEGAIAEAQAALGGLDVMLVSVQRANRLYGAAAAGAEHVHTGTTHLAAAIVATNGDRYPDVRREASAASKAFGDARAAFRAGQGIDATADFDKAMAYTDKLSAEATLLMQLADAGVAKQIPKYNALAAAQAATQRQLASLAQPSIIANRQAFVAKIDSQRAAVRLHLYKAQRLYEQVRAEAKAATR